MRVLNFLIVSALVLVIFGLGGALLVREVLLLAGGSAIRSGLTVLHRLSRDNLQFARQCRAKGGVTTDVPTIGQIQLRFISDREYLIEVVCSQFQSDPIVVERYSLPFLVRKTAGSSGIIWGTDRSAVELEVFGRRQVIGVENEEVQTFAGGGVTLGLSPTSTCQGYGYLCCEEQIAIGAGEVNNRVTDCPKSCFRSCQPRPILLALNTDPFFDEFTRTVKVAAGEPVTFSYVASYEVPEPVQITLEFGDGASQTLSTLTGKLSHTYQCATGRCLYTIKLRAVSASGVTAAETPITELKVEVQ